MAYITTERVKEIREQLKKEFPDIKFSITRENYSGVRICIMESSIDFNCDYKQVTNYHIKNTYTGRAAEVLSRVNDIANFGVKIYDTADYGNQPDFYVWLNIGKWDKPYIQIGACEIQIYSPQPMAS